MMEPSPTPYDLRWRMFGIDVRVHPMFWLVSLLLGSSALSDGIPYLLIWVGCMFVSILVHELGHVWMGQLFGSYGHIVLYSFGGLAIGSSQLDRRWQRILVFFAGPLAGFMFLGMIFVVLGVWNPNLMSRYLFVTGMSLGLPRDWFDLAWVNDESLDPHLHFMVYQLIFINLMWGLLNLLPVWPLDGGQISRDVCESISLNSGLTHSLGISMAVAGLLSLHCFLVMSGRQLLPWGFGSTFSAIMFAILAVQSYQLLQQAQARNRWMDDRWNY